MDLLQEKFSVTHLSNILKIPSCHGHTVVNQRFQHGFLIRYGGSDTYTFKDGTAITENMGELLYLPKDVGYTVGDNSQKGVVGCYAINFDINLEGDFKPFKLKLKNADYVLREFITAERAWQKKPVGFYEDCMASLYKIIAALKSCISDYHSSKEKLLLQPAVDYIIQNYTEHITTKVLAKQCGISESYLRRLFSKAYLMSPTEYARQMRLSYAKRLLESGEFTVTAVAELSGFNDISYFSREFKKLYKVSPGKL